MFEIRLKSDFNVILETAYALICTVNSTVMITMHLMNSVRQKDVMMDIKDAKYPTICLLFSQMTATLSELTDPILKQECVNTEAWSCTETTVTLPSVFPKGYQNQLLEYQGSHQHVQAWTPVLFMVWWNGLVICQCFCFLIPFRFTVDSWVRGHPLNEEGICGDPWKGTRSEQKMESPWLQRQKRQTQGPKDRPNHLLSTMTSFY